MRGFLLDMDGVVTDQHAKVNPEVLEKVSKLKNVAFVTGREPEWIKEHVFSVKKLSFPIVCELGTVVFKDGEVEVFGKQPVEAEKRVKEVCEGLEGVWRDPNKKTMVSVEHNHNADPELVERDYAKIVPLVKQIGKETGMVVSQTTYAIDLIWPGSNKKLGAKKAMEYVHADEYVIIGDSPIDLKMIEAVEEQGKKYAFYYVGEMELTEEQKGKVVATNAKYDKGALEVLSQYSG